MQPNTYVYQPNAHYGYRRFMARCIVDVYHMGSLPRRAIGHTQATAQNMAHPTMDQKLNARHSLQHHTHICACRNRFCRFRAPSMETLGDMLNQITESPHWDMLPQIVNAYPLVFIAIITGLLLHMSPHAWTIRLQQTYAAYPAVLQAIILAAVIFAVIQTRSADLVPFVYLQY